MEILSTDCCLDGTAVKETEWHSVWLIRACHSSFSVSSLTPAQTQPGLPGLEQGSQNCDQWPRSIYKVNMIESLKRSLKRREQRLRKVLGCGKETIMDRI